MKAAMNDSRLSSSSNFGVPGFLDGECEIEYLDFEEFYYRVKSAHAGIRFVRQELTDLFPNSQSFIINSKETK